MRNRLSKNEISLTSQQCLSILYSVINSEVFSRLAVRTIAHQQAELLGQSPNAVVPVLRAGFAMFQGFHEKYPQVQPYFAKGTKLKGSTNAKVDWLSSRPPAGSSAVILDVVCATGDTAIAVAGDLYEAGVRDIIFCTAIVSPKARQAIQERFPESKLLAACIAEGVDENGWLIPPTNGDIGDKLYGVNNDPFSCMNQSVDFGR